MNELVRVLRDYQRWMTDNNGEPSISLDDINGDETFGAAADRIEALEAGIETIRTAAEFHGRSGVSDHVMRYAHETTARLCDTLLSVKGASSDE